MMPASGIGGACVSTGVREWTVLNRARTGALRESDGLAADRTVLAAAFCSEAILQLYVYAVKRERIDLHLHD